MFKLYWSRRFLQISKNLFTLSSLNTMPYSSLYFLVSLLTDMRLLINKFLFFLYIWVQLIAIDKYYSKLSHNHKPMFEYRYNYETVIYLGYSFNILFMSWRKVDWRHIYQNISANPLLLFFRTAGGSTVFFFFKFFY